MTAAAGVCRIIRGDFGESRRSDFRPDPVQLLQIDRQQDNVENNHRIDVREDTVENEQNVACERCKTKMQDRVHRKSRENGGGSRKAEQVYPKHIAPPSVDSSERPRRYRPWYGKFFCEEACASWSSGFVIERWASAAMPPQTITKQ